MWPRQCAALGRCWATTTHASLSQSTPAHAADAALLTWPPAPQGRCSPCWESITAPRHLLLLMTQPIQPPVTCYEQPLYQPTPEEASDPALFAGNVRALMARLAQLPLCNSSLEVKRKYHKRLKEEMGLQA